MMGNEWRSDWPHSPVDARAKSRAMSPDERNTITGLEDLMKREWDVKMMESTISRFACYETRSACYEENNKDKLRCTGDWRRTSVGAACRLPLPALHVDCRAAAVIFAPSDRTSTTTCARTGAARSTERRPQLRRGLKVEEEVAAALLLGIGRGSGYAVNYGSICFIYMGLD
jgi:hypothetical protein